ncbi:MAG: nitrile hydratase subunit beta [Methyloligellaceae bacterium]
MDGIHDLGGRQGFGRVDTDEPEEPFHSDWEARLYGLVRAMTRAPDWSIDWFRHCRELIDPVDYLTRGYYDQWLQTYAAMMVNSGLASVSEIASGKAQGEKPDLPAPMSAQDVHQHWKRYALDTEREVPERPAFKPGDRVRTRAMGSAGHTRLPGYLRGRSGIVEAYRGAHLLPDVNALQEERAEPLYTVGFAARDLWPEAADSKDTIFADLWESYLEQP